MILLCEECWKRITGGKLEDLRSTERQKIKYVRGSECAFYHVWDGDGKSATQRLNEFGRKKK